MAFRFLQFLRGKSAKVMLLDVERSELSRAEGLSGQYGELERAIETYDAVILRHPQYAEAHYKRANALNGLGRWESALAGYDRAIEIDPEYANAFCNRGAILERLGRYQEALGSYDRAVKLNPKDALAYYNRGVVLRAMNKPEEALHSYRQALQIRPAYAEAHINSGNIFQELQRYEEALNNYDQAIELNPSYAQAFLGRGLALGQLRRFEAALASHDQAIALNDNYVEAYVARGNLLQELLRFEAAIASYDAALSKQADTYSVRSQALQARGMTLLGLRRVEDAVASFDAALALKPDTKFLLGMRRHAQMYICEWKGLTEDLIEIERGLRDGKPVCVPLAQLALSDSLALNRLAAEIWVREECASEEYLGPFIKSPPRSKIRIGYFSSDFRDHPVALLTAKLFEIHDRSRFEVIAFAFGPEAKDAVRSRLERAFDQFIDVRSRSDHEVASLARDMNIDIAVDLGGFTEYGRTKIFAMRAAPIQISYLGFLGTMGAPYIDYLIADRIIVPTSAQQHYSEKIIYLPSYQANDSRQIAQRKFTRAELGLPEKGFVFSCFNANYKITPNIFDAWMRILKRVEHSCLYLYVDTDMAQKNLQGEAWRQGVDPQRIAFGKRIVIDEYFARYRIMDLFLDTSPYNAGTTASDALWSGLPVLTCAGQTFASRVAASLLTAVGLPELITETIKDYEEMAVRLATHPGLMVNIRERLAGNRESTALFDIRRFTASLETAFELTYKRRLHDLDPDNIYVDSCT